MLKILTISCIILFSSASFAENSWRNTIKTKEIVYPEVFALTVPGSISSYEMDEYLECRQMATLIGTTIEPCEEVIEESTLRKVDIGLLTQEISHQCMSDNSYCKSVVIAVLRDKDGNFKREMVYLPSDYLK